ncbi:fumarylacetoacetate hydrolase family protein [Pseudanabaena sp. FACHB-2040]|uniref:fumarylacetoacetate hydrolase family protein n=1 Tax=Pseudanabaena sp. FACHB-2040 TaxID=2692859 RepID=UPI001688F811|nr:fumarylacetoacetate hydrolase family protein [Pseudanabaena sp. FACHB-2040]MBD2260628.1 fumarylacetoacetate hydrolase family protein [Pseudanabaena sp. FACHB-2040]
MAQRYVRVQSQAGQLHYGLLQPDRSVFILDAPPWLQGQVTEAVLPPDGYTLLAPCAPSKIVAVGKNYAKHAAEMGTPLPLTPLLFLKPSTTVTSVGAPIYYPSQSQEIDYEGELAIIIGERCVDCTPEQVQSKIWGYTIANDVTARDLQRQDGQWTRAKSFDSFCPLGPWIVRELSPGARIQTFLNNRTEPVQSASLDEMVFKPEFLVAYISQIMTLLPGDVVLTGTPEGVGPLAIGDRVRVEIEGIGTLENVIATRHPAVAPIEKS